MITVNMHEAKSRLSALIKVMEETGQNIVICRHGEPVAEISPVKSKRISPLQMHPELAGRILYDPLEPATADEWPEALR